MLEPSDEKVTEPIDSQDKSSPKRLTFRERLKKGLQQGASKTYGSVHDILYHYLMSDRDFAIDFLKTRATEWANILDFDKLTVSPNDFYDEQLQKRVADVIVNVPYKADANEESVNIAIVIEHKAQSRTIDNKWTIGKLILYLVMETISALNQTPRPPFTPQALALLVYNGDDPNFETPVWKNQFELPPKLREYALEIKIPCINLTKLYKEGALGNSSPLVEVACTAMAAAGLRCLKSIRKTLLKPLNKLTHWNENIKRAINAIVQYVIEVAANEGNEFTREEYDDLFIEVDNPEVRKTVKTIFDEAEEQGEIRGEIRGKINGKRETVNQVLVSMYPNRPSELDSNIWKLGSLDQLNSVLNLILAHSPLEEITRCVTKFLHSSNKSSVVGA